MSQNSSDKQPSIEICIRIYSQDAADPKRDDDKGGGPPYPVYIPIVTLSPTGTHGGDGSQLSLNVTLDRNPADNGDTVPIQIVSSRPDLTPGLPSYDGLFQQSRTYMFHAMAVQSQTPVTITVTALNHLLNSSAQDQSNPGVLAICPPGQQPCP